MSSQLLQDIMPRVLHRVTRERVKALNAKRQKAFRDRERLKKIICKKGQLRQQLASVLESGLTSSNLRQLRREIVRLEKLEHEISEAKSDDSSTTQESTDEDMDLSTESVHDERPERGLEVQVQETDDEDVSIQREVTG